MKKLLATLAITVTLFSCDEAKPADEPTIAPENNANSPINDAKLTDSSAMKEDTHTMEVTAGETEQITDTTKETLKK